MNGLPNGLKRDFAANPYLSPILSLGILTLSIGLGLYAYLGTFSRYGSDDYCLTAFFLQDDLGTRLIQRHFTTTGRYTNILFIGLADKIFGWYNVAILPPLMLALFVLGLYLLSKEIGEVVLWGWGRSTAFFLAASIAYFSFLQAPNLYETLYWRAGMTSHFAPLVFFLFLGVFLLRQIRNAGARLPSVWIQAVCFLGPLLAGGLSEPPTAVVVTISSLAIFGVWRWGAGPSRRSALILLAWYFAGALLALLIMAFAPANSLRLQTAPPGFLELVSGIIIHPLEFIVDTLRTLPTPTLMSIAMPAVLFFVKFRDPAQNFSREARHRLILLMIAVLLLAYLLIAASFAPSVYGQSYPIARARFAGRVLMTSAFMINGALLGMLVASLRLKLFQSPYLQRLGLLALVFSMLYPLRGVWRVSTEIPAYQQRAAAWDLRDSEIRALEEQGIQDLVVRFLPDEQLQELGDHTGFRLNRCASRIYGVASIVAVPMDEE